ncbi:MAG: LysR family transcriptional regulator [Pseudomonadota bacterium]|nr:LysR family transcriptional regulator [Pseudomonadota bacterium]
MIEYISDLRLFLTISRTLNFRQAGEKLGYSPAVVTTRMKRLETVTGKSLFIRSTRHVKLTEEGHKLVAVASKIIDLSEEISRPAPGNRAGVNYEGTVRIATAHSFARRFLSQPIAAILAAHPALTIDLVLDDGLSQLIQQGIDISFRIGGEDSPSLTRYQLLEDKRILLAAPDYLAKRGNPASPAELREHQCLSFPSQRQWALYRNNQVTQIALRNVMYCNTGDFLTQMAREGAGITVKSVWSVQTELKEGSLVHVLPDYEIERPRDVCALIPKREYTPDRVMYVLECIKKHITMGVGE